MKNTHILPTDKPSRVVKIYNDVNRETFTLKLDVEVNDSFKEYVNIYIISEEKIKDDNYFIDLRNNEEELYWEDIYCAGNGGSAEFANTIGKKIILTTDQELIKDGVQPIDDEFLEWFVENPSCESVEIIPLRKSSGWYDEKEIWHWDFLAYKIIIPKDEPKQETLEEVAERLYPVSPQKRKIWINGAKWQQERMYSEEEVHDIIESYQNNVENNPKHITYDKWVEQFKKK